MLMVQSCCMKVLNRSGCIMNTISKESDRIAWELMILEDLKSMSYEDVATKHATSRGTVYSIAVKHGARKHEQRIQEKKKQKKLRRQEFLSQVVNATVKSDVLDYLDGLPDGSVDLWITSPPYSIGKSYEESLGQFGLMYYVGWLLQVVSEMARTLSEQGTLCLQLGNTKLPSGQPYPIDALIMEHLRSMGLNFKSRIIWTASHGLTPKERLSERYETVLVFTRGDQSVFNPNAARQPQKQPEKRAYKGKNKGQLSGHPLGAHPSNVWTDIGTVKSNSVDRKDCGNHPAPFPIKLVKRLILLYSLPGDLVGDPFCGSGSTSVGAFETGRAFTGADLLYEDLREDRLSRLAPDLITPLTGITDRSVAAWMAEAKPKNNEACVENSNLTEGEIEDLFGVVA